MSVAQAVEHLTVAQKVAGSNPVAHPTDTGVDLARVNKIIQFAWGGGVEDGDTFKLDDLHLVE